MGGGGKEKNGELSKRNKLCFCESNSGFEKAPRGQIYKSWQSKHVGIINGPMGISIGSILIKGTKWLRFALKLRLGHHIDNVDDSNHT